MAEIIGLAIENDVVRTVTRRRDRFACAEFAWNGQQPELTVAALREEYGGVGGVCIAIGLGALEIARPDLPPMSQQAARRVLLRDADRYFPTDEPLAVSHAGALAFATPANALQRWVRAFEQWAPVRAVVAAPDAIAAAIGANAVAERAVSERALTIEAARDERGVLRVRDGVPIEVRRVRNTSAEAAATGTAVDSVRRKAVPSRSGNDDATDTAALAGTLGVPFAYSAALGALQLVHAAVDAMLLDANLERMIREQRNRRAWRSYATVGIAAALLLAAVNTSRNRTLHTLESAADSLARASAPGVAAREALARTGAEARALAALHDPAHDPLAVLATVSRALPRDAFVDRIEWDGREWRIEGSANAAATIVPSLDAESGLTGVRVLSASTRFRDGARMRESFAVAFRVSAARTSARRAPAMSDAATVGTGAGTKATPESATGASAVQPTTAGASTSARPTAERGGRDGHR